MQATPRAWVPATWRPHEARCPRQKCSCVSCLTWGWRKVEMKLLALDIATQGWTSSQCKWEMPMLIKCHLNYFCQGYKKKLETSSLGYLLVVIYKSSVCWACNMHYFPFENKKKLLKYQSAFQMAKWFVFQLTFSDQLGSLSEMQASGINLWQYKIKAELPCKYFF